MDDNELTERLARDLDGSFEVLVRTHVDRCYAIALRVLGNPHDAEEVAQDALVRALHLRAWLATIVVNLCRNRVRRHPVPTTPLAPLVEAGREPPADGSTDPAALALAGADRERLAGLLATLPDRYRIPVILRHVDDLSYAELAEVLGRPDGTLNSQVSRGLAMLRAAATAPELEELTA